MWGVVSALAVWGVVRALAVWGVVSALVVGGNGKPVSVSRPLEPW